MGSFWTSAAASPARQHGARPSRPFWHAPARALQGALRPAAARPSVHASETIEDTWALLYRSEAFMEDLDVGYPSNRAQPVALP